MNKFAWVPFVLVAVMMTAVGPALADVEVIDFDALMQDAVEFIFEDGHPFAYLDPDGYWKDQYDPTDPHEWVAPCDNNDNGIYDAIEFAVLLAIIADGSNPNHDTVHEAWRANNARFDMDAGALAHALFGPRGYSMQKVLAAYATLGDGGYQRYANPTPPPADYGYDFTGSWGIFAETLYGMRDYGSYWSSGAPDSANYVRLQTLLSACGDADGDGVANIAEFHGQGGNRANYVAAALDAGTTVDGGDPAGVCAPPIEGAQWGVNYFYNPTNKHVYHVTPINAPWIVVQYYAEHHELIGVPIPGDLVTIRSQAENDWLWANVLPVGAGANFWIGFNDVDVEGVFVWASGEAVAYTNWNTGEPNNSGNEDAAEIYPGGKWNDKEIGDNRVGIVEFVGPYDDLDTDGVPDWWEGLFVTDDDSDGMPGYWETLYGLNPNDPSDAAGDLDSDGLTNLAEFQNGTVPTNPDTDGDGVNDGDEVNVYFSDPTELDTDGDGLSDGEEVNTHGTSPTSTDSDSDGMPDGYEVAQGLEPTVDDAAGDADADLLTNLQEYQIGSNPHNLDSDGDGLADGYEVTGLGSDPTRVDTDGDGLADGAEINLYNTNPVLFDTDGDGMPDGWEVGHGLEPDDATGANGSTGDPDGDGMTNVLEYTQGTDPLVNQWGWITNPGNGHQYKLTAIMTWAEAQAQAQAWGGYLTTINDAAENEWVRANFTFAGKIFLGANDLSSEGTWVWVETGTQFWSGPWYGGPVGGLYSHWASGEPNNSADEDISEMYQDGFWNDNDPESRLRGLVEVTPDRDADGLADEVETNTGVYLSPQDTGADPDNPDSDGDGMLDGWEVAYGLDPNSAAGNNGAAADPDGDGLANIDEQTHGSNPGLSDTDGDGLNDGYEVYTTGTSPASADTDADGLADNVETDTGVYVGPGDTGTDPNASDSDGDGMADGWEVGHGLNPNSSSGDDGGTADPDSDGLSNVEEFANGTNPWASDTDGDTLEDGYEVHTRGTDPTLPDTDGDGLTDNIETNTGVYVSPSDTGTDPLQSDTDGDGLTDLVETNTGTYVDPNNTGTNPFETDTDGDSFNDRLEVYYETDPLDPNEPAQPKRKFSIGAMETLFDDPNLNVYFPKWSSDGRRIAYIVRHKVTGATDVYITNLDKPPSDPQHTIQITQPGEIPDDWNIVAWSPDDSIVMYGADTPLGSRIVRKSSSGDGMYFDPLPIPPGGLNLDLHATCLPTGNRLIMGRGDCLYVYEITPAAGVISGPRLVYVPDWSEDPRFAQFSADGTKVVFNIRPYGDPKQGDLYVLDVESVLTGLLPVPYGIADGLATSAIWPVENRINYAQCPSFTNDAEMVFWSEDVNREFIEPAQPSTFPGTNFDVMVGSSDGIGVPQQLLFRIDDAQIHTSPGGLRMSYTRDWALYAVTLVATQQAEGNYDPVENTVTTLVEQVMEDGSGTELAIPPDVVIDFPEGAATEITMESPVSPIEDPVLPPGVDAVPVIRTFGPSGTEFTDPVTGLPTPIPVTITYTDAQIAGMVESQLHVYMYDEIANAFVQVNDSDIILRDFDGNSITFTITHFSTYGLGGGADTDGDGIPDALDDDDDNDGIPDVLDPMPLDSDNDGFNNAVDADDDGDGAADGDEATTEIDTDNDGIPNSVDADDDNDGLTDVDEVNVYGTNPLNSDSDADGLTDGDEVNVYGTNPLSADSDADGLSDSSEIGVYGTNPMNPDSDGDGLNDGDEVARGVSPFTADTDGDGLSDGEEVHVYHSDPRLLDTDNDKLNDGDEVNIHGTDPADWDSDDDGLVDGWEVSHGLDPKDADSDDDGLDDGVEVNTYSTGPANPDCDGDGLSDGDEVNIYGTVPLNPDTDGDGLSDGDEVHLFGTDPADPDTDNDGLTDGYELTASGTDPLNPDTDGDGLNDGVEPGLGTDPNNGDSDGDGLSDGDEVNTHGTDPNNPDSDGDGVSDGIEVGMGTDPNDEMDYLAVVTYEGDSLLSTQGSPAVEASLVAALRDNHGEVMPIEGAEVTFTLAAEGVGTITATANTSAGWAEVLLSLEPAIYMIVVTEVASGAQAMAVLTVYNPEGGFATGGGWIKPADDGLNTHPNVRANFGFVAKYKQGRATGNLEFRYTDGYIDLKSTSIQQLVITGGKIAQFKGWAGVNGEQGNWFFAKAIDNGEPGVGLDVFDIKVWAPGVSTNSDPTERAGGALGGGNIVVHTK